METQDPYPKTRPTTLAPDRERIAPSRREVTDETPVVSEPDVPRMEPWVKPMLWSLVPLLLAFVVPRGMRMPLMAVTAALFVGAVVMLFRQPRASRPDAR